MVSNLHKETKGSFYETISDLYFYEDNSGNFFKQICLKIFEYFLKNSNIFKLL